MKSESTTHSGIPVLAKYLLLASAVLAISHPARSQRPGPRPIRDGNLPVLNVVQSAALMPSYSCRNPGSGYANTALSLSPFSTQRGDPELLFNGACGADDYFQVSLAGDSLSLIADLGANLPLDSVSAQKIFNLQNVFTFANFTQFSSVAKIIQAHTYASIINQEYVRGLFVFTVVKFVPDVEVDLQYEVKDYQVTEGPIARSAGFDWNR